MGRSTSEANQNQLRVVTKVNSWYVEVESDEHLAEVAETVTEGATEVWIVWNPIEGLVYEVWIDTEPPLEYLEQRNWVADLMVRND